MAKKSIAGSIPHISSFAPKSRDYQENVLVDALYDSAKDSEKYRKCLESLSDNIEDLEKAIDFLDIDNLNSKITDLTDNVDKLTDKIDQAICLFKDWLEANKKG